MTREEAIKFWKFRYENAKDYTDPHWEAQERREHREYVEALRMAIESLQREDEFLKNLESNEPQFYDEDDYWNGRIPTVQAEGGDAEMNEVKSPYMQHSPNGATHGRLIDADALSKKLCETTIFIKDGEVFQRMINDAPTEQAETVHKPDYSYETDMARRLIEETLKNKLQELAQCDDYEMAHMKADKLLCDFITKLGYGEVAQKFDAVPKWYA